MNTDRLKSLAISDTGFIFDPATGSAFSSNSVGLKIIECLKAGMNNRKIIASLLEIYEVSPEELESDIVDFIRSLEDVYLI
ncbi:MAG: PqqD family protein [Syntrophobacteraceae bacterium]